MTHIYFAVDAFWLPSLFLYSRFYSRILHTPCRFYFILSWQYIEQCLQRFLCRAEFMFYPEQIHAWSRTWKRLHWVHVLFSLKHIFSKYHLNFKFKGNHWTISSSWSSFYMSALCRLAFQNANSTFLLITIIL